MKISKFVIGILFVLICGAQSDEPEHIADPVNTPEPTGEGLGEVVLSSEEQFSPSDLELNSALPPDLTLPEEDDEEESQSSENATLVLKNSTHVFINCSRAENVTPEVELVNSTRLLSLLVVNPNITRAVSADCLGVYFFARWCPFSTMAAPHINALPRAFPNIRMVAVDAMKYHVFNTQYGVVGVPTFILFHNGRPSVKFNETDYNLERFSSFITKFTTIQPVEKISVTSADFNGPVPSVVVKEPDYFLWLSWYFLAMSAIVFFTKSSLYRKIVEVVKVTWRESEAQHDHMD
ncbi:hypothetical protein ONE63_002632 [Megalurothrips usitatus]|uniref:Thioredoxin domain-containing protein n=1 Tax=Megalurothrips usitatus TaxID=439358 RepID=A0AAV7XD14_9NEOP|nr:hypothetical protein ONE63_002632 [Megalurothrips usitatus]